MATKDLLNPKSIHIKRYVLLLVIILSFAAVSYGQNLVNSRTTSYFTYLYKITDIEAEKVYKRSVWSVDSTYFHTLADSFPTDSLYTKILPAGHYLKTYAAGGTQKVFLKTVQNLQVFVLNNNSDLCIQVYDLRGNLVDNAKLKVRGKTLRFNKQMQAYIDKKSNKKGLLSITHNGFTSYFNLERSYNNPLVKRLSRKAIYGTPIKFAWVPVSYVVHLPIDGTKSLIRMRPQGTISRTWWFFKNKAEKIACLFDDYYCNDFEDSRKYKGYFITIKPKYLPNDTVKFKSFITKKGKPIDKDLYVELVAARKTHKIGLIQPYRKNGGYAFEFHLHDSLNLTLDRSYLIYLKDLKGKIYQNGAIWYEDYELTKNKLALRTETDKHYRGKPFSLFVKGTDENDLNLLDGRLEILVETEHISDFYGMGLFVPDTIWHKELPLEPSGETEIVIPDSLFPKINCKYTASISLLTSDNERLTKTETLNFYHKNRAFEIETKTDSIHFTYLENGEPKNKRVKVFTSDAYNNLTQVYAGFTPCQVEINPIFHSYIIETDSLKKNVSLASQPSMVQCFSERTTDSVFFQVDNPRSLHLSYNVYKLNHSKEKGYTDSLSVTQKAKNKQNYFVSVRYIWGGRVKKETYTVPLLENKLNVKVEQPRLVYPGQETEITVSVRDVDGNPVPNVDLTAHALTAKFDYTSPTVPNLQKRRKNKAVINNFSADTEKLLYPKDITLDYNAWKTKAGIDSIEYYKFLYPGNQVYHYSMPIDDSITQFAPFVVENGNILPVHIIYLNGRPVYFSGTTNKQPYSFKTSFGGQYIKLRTSKYEVILDSVYFKWAKKNIICVDVKAQNEHIQVKKAEPKLSNYEKNNLYRYLFPYRNNFGEKMAYIVSSQSVQLLEPSKKYSRYNIAGPINGKIDFNVADEYETLFMHEAGFEYDFAPGLLKMRETDLDNTIGKYLKNYGIQKGFSDLVLTESKVLEQWQEYLDFKRYATAKYRYPNSTYKNHGKLHIKRDVETNTEAPKLLNLIVLRHDDYKFLRIYPGNTSMVHDLGKGYHRIIFFYKNSEYQVQDSVYIYPNGLNYLEVNNNLEFKKDSFSIYLDKKLEENLFSYQKYEGDELKDIEPVFGRYLEQFSYVGPGRIIEGVVIDEESGEPLPGVNVVVDGTTYGCVTNLDGKYSINVPSGSTQLHFSFIGYSDQVVNIGNNHEINMSLLLDMCALEEVVVVGYGTVKKSCVTGSVATVQSYNLLSAAPGVSANISAALQGRVAGMDISSANGHPGSIKSITIRGAGTTNFDKAPLIIMNGNVYTGDLSGLSPEIIKNAQVLKDESAVAIYGSRAANGVILINTEDGTFKPTMPVNNNGADFDNTFFESASKANSIRSNFSDYAFWQPSLVTNAEGKATFKVTFPDDVTNWETHVLAMNNKKQSGQASGAIKSFKPIMAQLSVPRFMVESDSANIIGKVLNYMPDSVQCSSTFELNGVESSKEQLTVTHSHLDTLPLTAAGNTVRVKYSIVTTDNYFDGELREVPVFRKGLEETQGHFYVLNADTTIRIEADSKLGPVTLYSKNDVLNVVESEISRLIKYKYNCNEQMASKLRALLAEKQICAYKSKEFTSDKQVKKLIRLILKNQNESGLWGWWGSSETNYWISCHILGILIDAQEEGYMVKLNAGKITEALIYKLSSVGSNSTHIQILDILHRLGSHINMKAYINSIEPESLTELIRISVLKQAKGMEYDMDTLMLYEKTTLFGNTYFADDSAKWRLTSNEIQNTLLMYQLLKTDSTIDEKVFQKMRNYFYESRKTGYWRNTYESAQIIQTILPDILNNGRVNKNVSLTISGDIEKEVSEFPFEMQFEPNQNISITKTGKMPVYLTTYQQFWNPMPKEKSGDFEIETYFEDDSSGILEAGKPIKLIAKVTVNKDAEYVMVNIPIPGGCSYGNKKTNYYRESHREYFRNGTAIFCNYLYKGEYEFEVELIPRYTGSYTLNPAKVELMYFPVFNANNEIKRISID